ncbi:unnamed protein product, partial [Natator depressus]
MPSGRVLPGSGGRPGQHPETGEVCVVGTYPSSGAEPLLHNPQLCVQVAESRSVRQRLVLAGVTRVGDLLDYDRGDWLDPLTLARRMGLSSLRTPRRVLQEVEAGCMNCNRAEPLLHNPQLCVQVAESRSVRQRLVLAGVTRVGDLLDYDRGDWLDPLTLARRMGLSSLRTPRRVLQEVEAALTPAARAYVSRALREGAPRPSFTPGPPDLSIGPLPCRSQHTPHPFTASRLHELQPQPRWTCPFCNAEPLLHNPQLCVQVAESRSVRQRLVLAGVTRVGDLLDYDRGDWLDPLTLARRMGLSSLRTPRRVLQEVEAGCMNCNRAEPLLHNPQLCVQVAESRSVRQRLVLAGVTRVGDLLDYDRGDWLDPLTLARRMGRLHELQPAEPLLHNPQLCVQVAESRSVRQRLVLAGVTRVGDLLDYDRGDWLDPLTLARRMGLSSLRTPRRVLQEAGCMNCNRNAEPLLHNPQLCVQVAESRSVRQRLVLAGVTRVGDLLDYDRGDWLDPLTLARRMGLSSLRTPRRVLQEAGCMNCNRPEPLLHNPQLCVQVAESRSVRQRLVLAGVTRVGDLLDYDRGDWLDPLTLARRMGAEPLLHNPQLCVQVAESRSVRQRLVLAGVTRVGDLLDYDRGDWLDPLTLARRMGLSSLRTPRRVLQEVEAGCMNCNRNAEPLLHNPQLCVQVAESRSVRQRLVLAGVTRVGDLLDYDRGDWLDPLTLARRMGLSSLRTPRRVLQEAGCMNCNRAEPLLHNPQLCVQVAESRSVRQRLVLAGVTRVGDLLDYDRGDWLDPLTLARRMGRLHELQPAEPLLHNPQLCVQVAESRSVRQRLVLAGVTRVGDLLDYDRGDWLDPLTLARRMGLSSLRTPRRVLQEAGCMNCNRNAEPLLHNPQLRVQVAESRSVRQRLVLAEVTKVGDLLDYDRRDWLDPLTLARRMGLSSLRTPRRVLQEAGCMNCNRAEPLLHNPQLRVQVAESRSVRQRLVLAEVTKVGDLLDYDRRDWLDPLTLARRMGLSSLRTPRRVLQEAGCMNCNRAEPLLHNPQLCVQVAESRSVRQRLVLAGVTRVGDLLDYDRGDWLDPLTLARRMGRLHELQPAEPLLHNPQLCVQVAESRSVRQRLVLAGVTRVGDLLDYDRGDWLDPLTLARRMGLSSLRTPRRVLQEVEAGCMNCNRNAEPLLHNPQLRVQVAESRSVRQRLVLAEVTKVGDLLDYDRRDWLDPLTLARRMGSEPLLHNPQLRVQVAESRSVRQRLVLAEVTKVGDLLDYDRRDWLDPLTLARRMGLSSLRTPRRVLQEVEAGCMNCNRAEPLLHNPQLCVQVAESRSVRQRLVLAGVTRVGDLLDYDRGDWLDPLTLARRMGLSSLRTPRRVLQEVEAGCMNCNRAEPLLHNPQLCVQVAESRSVRQRLVLAGVTRVGDLLDYDRGDWLDPLTLARRMGLSSLRTPRRVLQEAEPLLHNPQLRVQVAESRSVRQRLVLAEVTKVGDLLDYDRRDWLDPLTLARRMGRLHELQPAEPLLHNPQLRVQVAESRSVRQRLVLAEVTKVGDLLDYDRRDWLDPLTLARRMGLSSLRTPRRVLQEVEGAPRPSFTAGPPDLSIGPLPCRSQHTPHPFTASRLHELQPAEPLLHNPQLRVQVAESRSVRQRLVLAEVTKVGDLLDYDRRDWLDPLTLARHMGLSSPRTPRRVLQEAEPLLHNPQLRVQVAESRSVRQRLVLAEVTKVGDLLDYDRRDWLDPLTLARHMGLSSPHTPRRVLQEAEPLLQNPQLCVQVAESRSVRQRLVLAEVTKVGDLLDYDRRDCLDPLTLARRMGLSSPRTPRRVLQEVKAALTPAARDYVNRALREGAPRPSSTPGPPDLSIGPLPCRSRQTPHPFTASRLHELQPVAESRSVRQRLVLAEVTKVGDLLDYDRRDWLDPLMLARRMGLSSPRTPQRVLQEWRDLLPPLEAEPLLHNPQLRVQVAESRSVRQRLVLAEVTKVGDLLDYDRRDCLDPLTLARRMGLSSPRTPRRVLQEVKAALTPAARDYVNRALREGAPRPSSTPGPPDLSIGPLPCRSRQTPHPFTASRLHELQPAEPLLHNPQLRVQVAESRSVRQRLVLAEVTKVGDLLDYDRRDCLDPLTLARRMGISSPRTPRRVLQEVKAALTPAARAYVNRALREGAPRPSSTPGPPDLSIGPLPCRSRQTPHPFTASRLHELQPVSFQLASRKYLYTLTLHTLHAHTLVSRPDTKWRDLLPPLEGEQPRWASLYSTLVPRPVGDISWRLLHGAVAESRSVRQRLVLAEVTKVGDLLDYDRRDWLDPLTLARRMGLSSPRTPQRVLQEVKAALTPAARDYVNLALREGAPRPSSTPAEPLLHNPQLRVQVAESRSVRQRLVLAEVTKVGDLLDYDRRDWLARLTLARRMGLSSPRTPRRVLQEVKAALTPAARDYVNRALREGAPRPSSTPGPPDLSIGPLPCRSRQTPHPFTASRLHELQPVSFQLASRKYLYTLTLHTLHAHTLVSRPDTKWRDLLPPLEGEQPRWAS